MKTFFKQFAKSRTEKFWVDEPSSAITLSRNPIPESVEAWLNGERMTGITLSDVVGATINLGPLRESDTVIINYQPRPTE